MYPSIKPSFILWLFILVAQSISADVLVTGVSIEYFHTAQISSGPNIEPFVNFSMGAEAIGKSIDVNRYATFPQGGATARSVISVGISPSSRTIRIAQFADAEGLFSLAYTVKVYFKTDSEVNILYDYEPIQEWSGNDSENGGVVMEADLVQRVGPNGYQSLTRQLGPVANGFALDQFQLAPNSEFRFSMTAHAGAFYDPQTGALITRVLGSRSAGALLKIGSLPSSDDFINFESFRTIPPPTISIAPAGTAMRLTWNASAVGYRMQSSPNLFDWTNLGSVITSAGTYDDPITNAPGRFYRLIKIP